MIEIVFLGGHEVVLFVKWHSRQSADVAGAAVGMVVVVVDGLDVAGLECASELDAALREPFGCGTDDHLVHGLAGAVRFSDQRVAEVGKDIAAAQKNGDCSMNHDDASLLVGI
ncbi:hypothetical protein [Devosia alba]|uniref:hypothetical protein n=1 Tax=Devosia alba TaxID=3152360 RepID=UPI0032649879